MVYAMERRELNAIAEQTGRSQSELIREAIDHRTDLPDFEKLRREWDRDV